MENTRDTQSRKWLLTINNPLDKGYSHDKLKDILLSIKGVEYWCLCDEIGGKTHTYHTHVFLFRSAPIRFSRLCKLFPGADVRMCKGTAKENRDYIRKEGKHSNTDKVETNLKDTFEEYGEVPEERQGQRNDLNVLYDMIKDGMTDYEILEEAPVYMTKLDTIDRVRETLRYKEFSNKIRDIHVEYWYGKSGTGKTSGVLNTYGMDAVYIVDDFRHPWDGYKGQDIVLFDEFDSEHYDFSQMLRWLDIYPVSLPCRYNNKMACYTKVFLTSNRRFEDQYSYIRRNEQDLFNAITRRIHVFREFDKPGHYNEYSSFNDYYRKYPIDQDGFIQISEETQLEIEDIFKTKSR